MATFTYNLNLKKPDKTEQYNIDDFNANADKIDNFAGRTPPNSLTADKLTTASKINGVAFDGTENIISGLGYYSSTETYAKDKIVYDVVDGAIQIYLSLADNNTGNPLTDTTKWKKINLSGDYVNKAGDTMSGRLDISSTENVKIRITNPNLDINSTTAPSSDIYNMIVLGDKNCEWCGLITQTHRTDNNFENRFQARRKIDGVIKLVALVVGISPNGTVYATAPTPEISSKSNNIATTSWVKQVVNSEVVVVVDTYVNGESGYRVWSDGFCEQWGKADIPTRGSLTVELMKPYLDINYNITVGLQNKSGTTDKRESPLVISSATTSSFLLGHTAGAAMHCNWRTSGYIS